MRRGRGFTLVEVMIALVIFSMIMVATISALRAFGNTRLTVERLTGRVLVDHETWPAYSDTGEVILDGTQVFVLAVQSERLRVRPIPNEALPRREAGQY